MQSAPVSTRILASILLATSLTAPSSAAAYRSAHETELLGTHLKNISGTPSRYSASQPAALSRNVLPLYPQRFEVQAPPAAEELPAPIAANNAPIMQAAPLPEALAATQTSSPLGDNGSIQLAAADTTPNHSPLAIPVSQMRLPPPPSDDAIRAFEEKTNEPVHVPVAEGVQHSPLQPIAQPTTQPVAAPVPVKVLSAPAPMASAEPNRDIIEPGVSYAPEPPLQAAPLSQQSKQVLASFPSGVDTPRAPAPGKVSIDRISPDIKALVMPTKPDASYEAAGIKIEVRRPGLDTNHEMMRAYDNLMAGNTSEAIAIYRDILSVEPNHTEALFGLAATLHRSGVTDKARPLYARLLKINPQHREALNNYLSLAGDEAPESALLELERLRLRNPSFSPIPAQMGLLYAKAGNFLQARAALVSAIQLAPENLVYQYNLAIILDQYGETADAAAIYGSLLKAKSSGAALPVDEEKIQKRYNFLSQALTNAAHTAQAH